MDAVKYMQEFVRMCDSTECANCEMYMLVARTKDLWLSCCSWPLDKAENAAKAVEIVEKWAKENPGKTNGARFIEVFGQEAYKMRRRADPLSEQDCEWWGQPYVEPKEAK